MAAMLPLFLLVAVPASGQDSRSRAADAADAFQLDVGSLTTDDAAAAPLSGSPVVESATPAAFSLDTPIERLLADPRARAVLDRTLPGLSDDENLPKFRSLSLRQFQPLTGGQLDDALLAKAGEELAAIAAGPPRSAPRKRLPAGR